MKLSATTQRLGKMEGRIVYIRLIRSEVLDQCPSRTLSLRYRGPLWGEMGSVRRSKAFRRFAREWSQELQHQAVHELVAHLEKRPSYVRITFAM